MSVLFRFMAALLLLVLAEGTRRMRSPQKKFLAVLLRTGGKKSPARRESIMQTWARDLEDDSLMLMQPDEECKKLYGDNHEEGLTCLEAKSHTHLMNKTDFEWLLVVDDDVFVFADRLRDTLRKMDPSKPEVYGEPYCGDCGAGRKGFCGGGGYVVSRQNLLKMASVTDAPVSNNVGAAFVKHMLSESQPGQGNVECDVRFACVAQDKGLAAIGVKGMYGNGIVAADFSYDEAEEKKVVDLDSQDPPLTMHNVRDSKHFQRLYKEYSKEKEQMKGKQTAYNLDSVKGLLDWVLPPVTE